jgi:hypothetical protein
MTGKRGYEAYFESWTPPLMEDETDTSNLNELFVQETLDPRIESVMPILSKLQKNLGEMKEVDELAEWADSLIEAEGESIQSNNPIGIPESEEARAADQKINTPAVQRKEKGDDWKVTHKDLAKADEKNMTSPAGMAALKKRMSTNEEEVEESALQAYLGDKKYGKDGMDALRDAGRKHVSKEKMQKIRAKFSNKEKEVDEGLDANQKRVGQLGPTEKVKNNNIGKLVGANENFIGMAPQAVAEGKGPLGQGDLGLALRSLAGNWSGWHEEKSHDPDIEVYEYDDGEGGYYASGSIEHNWKTGEIKVNYHDGEVGADIDETFHSIGDAMNALRGGYPASHGSGKAPNYDTLANKTLAGPDDLYKTDRAGKKGTLSKARMDGMKASSKYTMRGGPQGVLPEGQEDLDAIKRLLGK